MPHSFTLKYKGLKLILSTDVWLTPITSDSQIDALKLRKYRAIYDTGATNSVISQKVIDECGLHPTGMTIVYTAKGEGTSETYYVTICLPNKVCFPFTRVTKGILPEVDVLIGMDILSQGDFAVTNYENKTTFSFRVPSCKCIDFVERKQPPARRSLPKVMRNDPCPCGSGKKYKNCCGTKH